jgi:hypothetical protein
MDHQRSRRAPVPLNRVDPGAYDGNVRTVAGAVIAVALALVTGVLHVAVPPNETAEEGAADPILFLRRPVLRFLCWATPGWFRERPYLPWDSVVQGFERGPGGEDVLMVSDEIEREPVYRGLFWRVGARMTYRLRHFGEHHEVWRALRLCYAEGDRKFVAGEDRTPDPDGQLDEVTGFVPGAARAHWVEGTDERGDVRCISAWGDYDPALLD